MTNELFVVEGPDGEMISENNDLGFSVFTTRAKAQDFAWSEYDCGDGKDIYTVVRFVRQSCTPVESVTGEAKISEIAEARQEIERLREYAQNMVDAWDHQGFAHLQKFVDEFKKGQP